MNITLYLLQAVTVNTVGICSGVLINVNDHDSSGIPICNMSVG